MAAHVGEKTRSRKFAASLQRAPGARVSVGGRKIESSSLAYITQPRVTAPGRSCKCVHSPTSLSKLDVTELVNAGVQVALQLPRLQTHFNQAAKDSLALRSDEHARCRANDEFCAAKRREQQQTPLASSRAVRCRRDADSSSPPVLDRWMTAALPKVRWRAWQGRIRAPCHS